MTIDAMYTKIRCFEVAFGMAPMIMDSAATGSQRRQTTFVSYLTASSCLPSHDKGMTSSVVRENLLIMLRHERQPTLFTCTCVCVRFLPFTFSLSHGCSSYPFILSFHLPSHFLTITSSFHSLSYHLSRSVLSPFIFCPITVHSGAYICVSDCWWSSNSTIHKNTPSTSLKPFFLFPPFVRRLCSTQLKFHSQCRIIYLTVSYN